MKSPRVYGYCCFHSETGTEGGYWAFQDRRYIKNGQCSYAALHILQNGDHLTIYDKKDTKKVLWEGVLDLKSFSLFTEHTAEGLWIHADQVGTVRKVWEEFFLDEYPATLIKMSTTRKSNSKKPA